MFKMARSCSRISLSHRLNLRIDDVFVDLIIRGLSMVFHFLCLLHLILQLVNL
jgi:hypothetical protein